MQFQKLNAPSLKDLFVSQIREKILSGQLPVGSKMPPERDIAQQMQVSRAVINSGFETLAHQGFLEIRPRQGVYVADYGRYGNIDTLVAIMEYQGEMIRPQEIKSILEFRRALEHMVSDEVIQNASDQDIEDLSALVEAAANAESISSAVDITFRFHHGLSMISGNTILPLIYISFKPITTKLWQRYCNKYGVEKLCENTNEMLQALRNRDKGAARSCTDRHLDATIKGAYQIY